MSKYAASILTIAGTIIGAYFGGPAGASLGGLLGGLAGGLLFPTNTVTQGPRLQDTGTTVSNVGAPIPRGWGTFPAGGCIIVQTDLKEVIESSSVGAKGGPTQTTETPTYFQTFAIGINDGPIGGIRVIWANGKPIYDVRPQGQAATGDTADTDPTGPAGTGPEAEIFAAIETAIQYKERIVASQQVATQFTVYLGTEDQMPDPDLEAFYGVGNIPAFRGLAYVVFADWQNKPEDGNRMPSQWKFECFTESEDTTEDAGVYANYYLPPWTAGPNPAAGLCGDITYTALWPVVASSGSSGIGPDRTVLEVALSDVPFDVAGVGTGILNYLDYSIYPNIGSIGGAATSTTGGVLTSDVDFGRTLVLWLHYNDASPDVNLVAADGDADVSCSVTNSYWLSGGSQNIRQAFSDRWNYFGLGGNVIGKAPSHSVPPQYPPDMSIFRPQGWDIVVGCGGGAPFDMFLSPDSVIAVRRAPGPPLPVILDDGFPHECALVATPIDGVDGWGVYKGEIVEVGDWSLYTSAGLPCLTLQSYKSIAEDGLGKVTSYPRDPALPDGHQDYFNEQFWTDAYNKAKIYGLVASGKTYVSGGSLTNADNQYPHQQASIYRKGGTLTSKTTGVASVAQIFSDIIKEAGGQDSDIDVTSIVSKTVIGYVRTNVMAARDALTPLTQALFFNAIESNAKITTRLLGTSVVHTFEDADLGASVQDGSGGSATDSRLTSVDMQDVDLPRSVRVHYLSPSRDYELGEQDSPFRVGTAAVNDIDVQLPIVLDDTQALQIAQSLWSQMWAERISHTTVIDAEFQLLEPMDVVAIPVEGETTRVRINSISDSLPATRALGMVVDDELAYVSYGVASAVPPISRPVPIIAPAQSEFLDIPLLRDQDNDSGFYTAMVGLLPDAFKSAALYRSTDNGGNFTRLISTAQATIVGTVVAAVPSGPTDTFDEATAFYVDLFDSEDTLTSATQDAVLAGANAAAIGLDGRWEIVQFKTAAHQVDNIYLLSGLLRGRRGTEWAVGTSQPGDSFVLLSGVIRTPLDLTLVNKDIEYKTVGAGGTLDNALTEDFTGRGVALKPFSPCFLQGSRNGTTGDWTLTWLRRGRIGQTLQSGVDVPLSETKEDYEVDILDTDGTVLQTFSSSTESYKYLAGDQKAAFGTLQTSVTFTVYQVSAQVGRGYGTTGTVFGSVETDTETATNSMVMTFGAFASPPEFTINDDIFVYISFLPAKFGSVSILGGFHLNPGSPPDLDAAVEDLQTQASAFFGSKIAITRDGLVLTFVSTTGSMTGSYLYNVQQPFGFCAKAATTEELAEKPYRVQDPGPVDEGSYYQGMVDFYNGSGLLAPEQDAAYNVAGVYTKKFSLSAYDVETRRVLLAANSFPGSFPDHNYCPGARVNLDITWNVNPQTSGERFSYQVLQGMIDHINVDSRWTDYLLNPAEIISVGGRFAAGITLKPGYYLVPDLLGVPFFDSSPSYFMGVTSIIPGRAPYPTGRIQVESIVLPSGGGQLEFSTIGPFDVRYPAPLQIGQTFRISVDSHNYDHVIDADDVANTYTIVVDYFGTPTSVTEWRHHLIYEDMASKITAGGIFSAYFVHDSGTSPPEAGSLTLECNTGNVEHVVTAKMLPDNGIYINTTYPT